MNEEVFKRLLEAAKAMTKALDYEFCGGCPSSLTQQWEELERAVLVAEHTNN